MNYEEKEIRIIHPHRRAALSTRFKGDNNDYIERVALRIQSLYGDEIETISLFKYKDHTNNKIIKIPDIQHKDCSFEESRINSILAVEGNDSNYHDNGGCILF